MLDFIPLSWRTVAALLILVLFPGLALVRAPWPTVPALSVSFWILSWPVMPGAGSGRAGFVRAAIALFLLLGLLRVLQPRLWSRPEPWAVLTAAIAATALVPWARVEMPLLPDMSLDAATSRLLVWHDGIPRSFEPLLPGGTFVSESPGFQMLAADVAALGGGADHRAVFLVHRLGTALLVLAIAYGLSRIGNARGPTAALGAAVSAIALDLGRGLLPAAAVDLAAALLAFAFALVMRRSSRSAVVAAGFLALAAWAVLPGPSLLPVAAAVVVWVVAVAWVARTLSGRAPRAQAAAAVVLLAVYAWVAASIPRPAFTRAVQRAASWAASHVHPLEVICNVEGDSGRWLPALAGRAVTNPRRPQGWTPLASSPAKPCQVRFEDGSERRAASGPVLFRDGDVVLRQEAHE